MKAHAISKPIMQIREAVAKLDFDAHKERTPKIVLKRLIAIFSDVSDTRSQKSIDYPIGYILLIAFFAIMSGAETWTEMELFGNEYKAKLNGILPQFKKLAIPSHDTFRRVFGIINSNELQRVTANFLVHEISRLKEVLGLNIGNKECRHLCLDGKEQNGTGRKYGTDQKVSNLKTLHCYDVSNGIVLASVPIDAKTNEVPVAQELLKTMQLKNTVVTFDAMNTQKKTIA